jgi:hypothetical protein
MLLFFGKLRKNDTTFMQNANLKYLLETCIFLRLDVIIRLLSTRRKATTQNTFPAA